VLILNFKSGAERISVLSVADLNELQTFLERTKRVEELVRTPVNGD